MATTTYGNTIANISLRDRLVAYRDAFRVAAAQRRVYRQTVAELSALSNRDLADLGIARSMIRAVAHEAAFGA